MSFDRRENTRTVPRSPADVDARYAVIIKTFLSGVAEDALRMRFKYEARRRCDAIEYFLRKNKVCRPNISYIKQALFKIVGIQHKRMYGTCIKSFDL